MSKKDRDGQSDQEYDRTELYHRSNTSLQNEVGVILGNLGGYTKKELISLIDRLRADRYDAQGKTTVYGHSKFELDNHRTRAAYRRGGQ